MTTFAGAYDLSPQFYSISLLTYVLFRNAVGVIFRVTYGREVKSVDDYLVYAVEEAVQLTTMLSLPGRWLVDTIPARKPK
jgi:hypothetical protein